MTKSSQIIARAESVADELRKASQLIDSVSWNLDAALSAIGKDKAGYRTANAANRNGGANAEPGELETALSEAETMLALLRQAATSPFAPTLKIAA